MSQKNREPGFYWVKFSPSTRWEIMEWVTDYDGIWLVGERCLEQFMWDEDMYEIDERRIVREEPTE